MTEEKNTPKSTLGEKLVTKVGKLLSERPKKTLGYSRAYVYEPADFFEKQYGSLYFVIEIASPDPHVLEIGDMIIETMKEEYYADLDRDPLVSFESALKAANKELADLAAGGRTSWLNKINAICACLSSGTLHVTQVGSAEAYLLRNDQFSHISEGLYSPGQKPDPLKTFVNIASGTLEPEDRVIISTPGLFYSISLDQIKKTIADNSPTSAVKKLAELFKEEEDALGTSLLIIRTLTEDKISNEAVEEEEEIWIAEPKGKLGTLSDKTKPILSRGKAAIGTGLKAVKSKSKSVMPIFGKISLRIKGSFKKLKGQKKETSVSEPISMSDIGERQAEKTPLDKAVEQKPTSAKMVPEVKETEKVISEKMSEGVASEKEAPQEKSVLKKISHRTKSLVSDIKTDHSPGSNKYVYLAIIALVIFLASISILYYKTRANKELQRVQGIYNQASDDEQKAQAALIYKDRNTAKQKLSQASSLLDSIKDNKTYAAKVADLRAKISADTDKANMVYRIQNPSPVADFGQGTNATSLFLIGTDYYSYQENGTTVYRYVTKNKNVTKINKTLTPSKFQAACQTSDNTILLYDSGPGISEFDPASNSISPQPIALNGSWEKANAIASYLNYLYLLSPQANKVYRHAKTLSGYSIGVDYLANTNINLSKAVSITISETVFVLESDSKILQFSKGVEVPFQIKGMPFYLEKPTIIYTKSGFANIYIVDQKQKGVIVLDTAGNYKGEYVSSSFVNIKGLSVDEAGKKAGVLSDNKVYSFALQE